MPHIYYLNPQPNPFWDFVADIQDHPAVRDHQSPSQQQEQQQSEKTEPTPTPAQPEQTNAEDPPEVDPATLPGSFPHDRDLPFRGACRGGRGRRGGPPGEPHAHGHGPHERPGRGPPGPFPFGFGGFPFGGRPGPWWASERGPHPGPHPHPHGPHGHEERGGRCGGPGSRGSRGGHGGPMRGGPFGPERRHHHRGPSPPHHPYRRGRGGPLGGPGGFDLGSFLSNLGDRIGVDLNGAAEGLGLDRFGGARGPAGAGQEIDFEPRADIFDREAEYTIHVSLPGAKKTDVGVDWDGEHSHLRIAGVVHRPEVDEQMLNQLVVDGRKRETGVFEKTIRLGTKRDPASIDVAGIKAKMTDGVLIVRVPKVEKQHAKRDVPISQSKTPSPVPAEQNTNTSSEKNMLMFDADQDQDEDQDMYDNIPARNSKNEKGKNKDKEMDLDNASTTSTIRHEHDHQQQQQEQQEEQLPAYPAPHQHQQAYVDLTADEHDHDKEIEDWERSDTEDGEEGEYVKINVD